MSTKSMATKTCAKCGREIVGRRSNARYCKDCAAAMRRNYYKFKGTPAGALAQSHRVNYAKQLEARDTLIEPIIEKRTNSLLTGAEYTYRICPVCNCVLNKADRFCRFCGQRVRRDLDAGTQEV